MAISSKPTSGQRRGDPCRICYSALICEAAFDAMDGLILFPQPNNSIDRLSVIDVQRLLEAHGITISSIEGSAQSCNWSWIIGGRFVLSREPTHHLLSIALLAYIVPACRARLDPIVALRV
jgi:hypothetical protein